MDIERQGELEFLIKTDVPLPLVTERDSDHYKTSDIYDDHYTLRELVESELLSYLGHKGTIFFLRPRRTFKIFVLDEIKQLTSGELVRLSLTEAGKTDFVRWLDDAN